MHHQLNGFDTGADSLLLRHAIFSRGFAATYDHDSPTAAL
jgi:hypothetical protein